VENGYSEKHTENRVKEYKPLIRAAFEYTGQG